MKHGLYPISQTVCQAQSQRTGTIHEQFPLIKLESYLNLIACTKWKATLTEYIPDLQDLQ